MTAITDGKTAGLVEGSLESETATQTPTGTIRERRKPFLSVFVSAIFATTIFASVCAAEGPAECPPPDAIEPDSRRQEYRYHVIHEAVPRKLPNTFIATTFSGGGMRAAALSFGALKALHDTRLKIPKRYLSETDETTVPLINEVDYASSVSGGSVTAAYWALFGPREGIDTFRERFLDSNVRLDFLKFFTGLDKLEDRAIRIRRKVGAWFKKLLSSDQDDQLAGEDQSTGNRQRDADDKVPLGQIAKKEYQRIKALSGYFGTNLLNGATYQHLLERTIVNGDRPYLVINGTDFGSRSLFPFVQFQFDLLCSDLNTLKLADALAASTAFPPFFGTLPIKNLRFSLTSSQSSDAFCLTDPFMQQLSPHASVLDRTVKCLESDLKTNERELTTERTHASTARGELGRTEEELAIASRRYSAAVSALKRANQVQERRENHLSAARFSRKAAGISLRFSLAAEHARLRAYRLSEAAAAAAVDDSESRIDDAEREMAQLQRNLDETQEDASSNVDGWFRQLFGFVDKSWQELVDFVLAERSDSSRRHPGRTSAERDIERRDGTRESAAPQSVAVSPDDCGSEVTLPIPDGRNPVSFTLHHFGLWANRQQESEKNAAPWGSALSRVNATEATAGLPVTDNEAMERSSSDGAARRRLAALTELMGNQRSELARYGDTPGLNEESKEELRAVSGLIDLLEDRIRQLGDALGSAEDTSESHRESVTGSPVVSDEEQAHRDSSLLARRLHDLGTMLEGVSNHLEALEFAREHVRLAELELHLRDELHQAECREEGLRTQIGVTVEPLRDESSARRREWIDAGERRHRAMLTYLRAVREASQRRDALDQATAEVENLQREHQEAKRAKREAKARRDNWAKRFKEHSEEAKRLEQTGHRVAAHLGRASAVYSDYNLTTERVRSQIPYYLNENTKYIHVLDGGVADNLGVTPLVELLESFPEDFRLKRNLAQEWTNDLNRVAVISVDARVSPTSDHGESEESPGPVSTIIGTVNTAIESKSSLLTRELEQVTKGLLDKGIVSGRFLVSVDFNSIRDFHVHKDRGKRGHIHGRRVSHGELRHDDHTPRLMTELDRCAKAFSKIPTDWWLDDDEIDALVEIGYALVHDSAKYREFVGDGVLPANGETVHQVCTKFTEILERLEEERKEEAKKKTSQKPEPDDNPGN